MRVAKIAALGGFAWGFSTVVRPWWADTWIPYLSFSALAGIVGAVAACALVFAWRSVRSFLGIASGIDDTFINGMFGPISSDIEASAAVKTACGTVVAVTVVLLFGRLSSGIGLWILDSLLFFGLAAWVFQTKSRIAACWLLALAILGTVATGFNRFFDGFGGSNLFPMILILWSSVRLVMATSPTATSHAGQHDGADA